MAYPVQINKGDTVWLKTGSPAMVVNNPLANANKAECTWFENLEVKEGYFAHEALTKEKPEVDEVLTDEKYNTLIESIEKLTEQHRGLSRAISTIDTRIMTISNTVSTTNSELSKLIKSLADKKIIQG